LFGSIAVGYATCPSTACSTRPSTADVARSDATEIPILVEDDAVVEFAYIMTVHRLNVGAT
jgi:hypothetical protein